MEELHTTDAISDLHVNSTIINTMYYSVSIMLYVPTEMLQKRTHLSGREVKSCSQLC